MRKLAILAMLLCLSVGLFAGGQGEQGEAAAGPKKVNLTVFSDANTEWHRWSKRSKR